MVLAKFLRGVTLAIAEALPHDEHAALLVFYSWFWPVECSFGIVTCPRLRAAVFVNLVAMRECLTAGGTPTIVSAERLQRLARAYYLFRAAHNSYWSS